MSISKAPIHIQIPHCDGCTKSGLIVCSDVTYVYLAKIKIVLGLILVQLMEYITQPRVAAAGFSLLCLTLNDS